MVGSTKDVETLLEQSRLLSWHGILHIVLALISVIAAHQCVLAVYNLYFHPLRHIPGPPSWIALPLLKTLTRTTGRLDFQIRDHHDRYGEVIRTGPNEVSFIHPDAWKDIYGHGHKEFPKYYPSGVRMDPRRIVSSNAADHFRFRRAMLPAFSDKALMQQESLIRVYVDLLVDKLRGVAKTRESTDMVRWYNLTTFDLIADLAYGKPLQGLAEGKSNAWIDNIANMMKLMPILVLVGASPFLGRVFKLLAGSKIANSQREHMAHVTKMANDRIYRHKQADRGDFMDYMMRSRGQPHEMKDDELVANADLFMVAGSETTATLLSGATYWLLRTPAVLKKATQEVRQAFDSSDDINFTDVRVKLPYMIACLDEALRLFPPVPLGLQRIVPGGPPMHIAGLDIPEQTLVSVHQLSTMHSEMNFHKAHEYIPERWLQESIKDPSSPFYNDRRDAYRPFSYGPRDCIGRNLASHEMRLIMAKVLWNFDLVLDERCSNWYDQKIYALWSKPPLQVFIKARSDL